MLEILTVVVIIGLLAATASPIMISLLRDKDVSRMTLRISDIFRFARTRALERQAVLVRWSSSGGPSNLPGLQIHEAITTQAGAQAPTCSSTSWVAGSASSKLITSFPATPTNAALYPPWEDALPQFIDPAGSAQPYAEICYTGRGRTFIRYNSTAIFTPLTGVARINVTNTRTGFKRTIFIPPSTVARLAL